MRNWRENIFQLIGEPFPVLFYIADPDGLLCDEKIYIDLNKRDVEVVEYKEAISFRYIYETKYREALLNNTVNLAVRIKSDNFDMVPYDMLKKGKMYSISIGLLFPGLSASVIRSMDMEDLDLLYESYDSYDGDSTDQDTIEFILKKVYKVQYDVITNKTDLIRFLLSKHYKDKHYPDIINSYLVERLSRMPELCVLPLSKMLASSKFFYGYLHREWESFIDALSKKGKKVRELLPDTIVPDMQFPFFDADVRRLSDNLFTEGKLTPINATNKPDLPDWVKFGVITDKYGEERIRLLDKIFHLSEKLHKEMTYKEWIDAAFIFSGIKHKRIMIKNENDSELDTNMSQLQMQIDNLFESWIMCNYDSLVNIPYIPNPVMLQHVPHYLAYKNHRKLAVVVLDAMGLLQWTQIKECLESDYSFDQDGVFAWIPTITSVSRQSIFTGEMPVYYSTSIDTTSKEPSHWQLFWENQGVVKVYVEYTRASGKSNLEFIEQYCKPTSKVFAVVVNVIDDLVHTAIQGYEGLQAELSIWLETGYLKSLIQKLFNKGYDVYLLSDHGNRECLGTGRVAEGILAHTKGERVRVYNSSLLRDEAADKYNAVSWDCIGLPKDMHCLLAKAGNAFVTENKKVVSHGGMSLEEVIVPFIRILKKEH